MTVRGGAQECGTGVRAVQDGCAGRVGILGGYTGVVPGGAIPGYYPPTAQGGPVPAKRAP